MIDRKHKHKRTRATLILALTAAFVGCFAGVAQADFGFQSFSGSLLEHERLPLVPGEEALAPGVPQLTAGAHPDFTTTLELNVRQNEGTFGGTREGPDGNVRELVGYGPPGLIGNATVVPQCSFPELQGSGPTPACLPETQVGRLGAVLYTGGSRFEQTFPVYSMQPPPGTPAQFGVNIAGVLVFINANLVNRGGVYSIALVSRNVSEGLPIGGVKLTLWGVPASDAHDSVRIDNATAEGVKSAAPKLPFLSNPTACSGAPLEFSASGRSWQGASASSAPFTTDEEGRPLVIQGCQNVPFEASFTAQPTVRSADSPTGLKATVTVPQSRTPNGISTSQLRDAVISLPAGMSVDPASAAGLESCSASQIDLLGEAPASCPSGSKIGTVQIDTPLLEKELEGSVYLARQGENKFGSLLAIYIAIDDPQTGIVLKLPGRIETGPGGEVTASFTENPQVPFETLTVDLFGGSRAALVTPPTCGTYTSKGTFSPWSGTAPISASDSFQIVSGPGGGPCPNGGFDPKLAAGTTNPIAGAFSPFVLDLSREDGTQQLSTIEAVLPEGLLGRLAGIPYCPDSALAGISGAEGTGAAQLASPSCPAASQVGTVSVGTGAGPNPFFVNTGKAYLAGPYKGAPLSLAIVTPALAGPFDLGNVVVRTALRVDPTTTQITAVSDPLPTILHGIPLDLRDVRVSFDRAEFTLNPTNCREAQIGSTIVSTGGAVAHPANRFQVADCANLGFAPKLSLRLSGRTERAQNPALKAVLTAPAGEADVAKVQAVLPRSLFIDNRHISNPCTRVQFNAGAGNGAQCPAKSILGKATAYSPLLERPLTGYVYFRSNGGERQLPDLVASLGGQIHVNLVGFIDSVHKKGSEVSRTRTTFANVPDAPVSRFVLELAGGKKGLLQNSTNLCKSTNRATVKMTGQNGKRHDTNPILRTRCGRPS